MTNRTVVPVGRLTLAVPPMEPPGHRVLSALLRFGQEAVDRLNRTPGRGDERRRVGYGRLRGTGPGVSFGALFDELEAAMPIELAYPFEGSDRVGGAVWPNVDDSLITQSNNLAKLRWEAGADDLPMHVHEHSDRCIIVLEGRGFFHVSPDSLDEFNGARVETIAARSRDVFVFTRGVVHTFSTADEPMTLLSCQLPFLPFDDPTQYTLPRFLWTARKHLRRDQSTITMEWCYGLIGGC